MSPRDEEKFHLVRQWMLKAEEDYSIAQELVEDVTAPPGTVGLHARLAVERYLKACLAWNEVDLPTGREISGLLDHVEALNPKLARSLRECEALDGFTVDDEGEIRAAEGVPARDAVNLAENARDEIRYALADYVEREQEWLDYLPDALVTVFEAEDEVTLSMAKALLDEAGIPHYADGEGVHSLFDHISAVGPVRLRVPGDYAGEAREILANMKEAAPGEDEEPDDSEEAEALEQE